MSQPRFVTACVLGTGMMGPGIALTLALGGLRTTLLSRTPEGAAQGLAQTRRQAAVLTENQLAESADMDRALQLVTGATDFEASIAPSDLVIESGPEEMAWKQDLFARMDSLASPEAVLASNTSGLSITAIASRLSSIIRNCRPFLAAASPVVPLPAKKSSTLSPEFECTRMMRSSRPNGFCVA